MCWRNARLLSALVLTLYIPGLSGKVAWIETSQVIEQAELIVHGRVVKLELEELQAWPKFNDDQQVSTTTSLEQAGDRSANRSKPQVAIATIQIYEVVKGRYAGNQLKVIANRMSLADQTHLIFGDEYVLMLNRWGYSKENGEVLYRTAHYGISGSIAGPEADIRLKNWPSKPLRFYYRDDKTGTLEKRDFSNTAEFIEEVKKELARHKKPGSGNNIR